MLKTLLATKLLALICSPAAFAQQPFETDLIETSSGELRVTFIGHGTLMMEFQKKTLHIDPYGKLADYNSLPKADFVLITHEHRDHLDLDALQKIRTDKTVIVLTERCAEKVQGGIIMHNGDVETVGGIEVQAVPAYNIMHKRDSGEPYHPKGHGNGYVLTFGDTRVYIAGDTENIPEMKALRNIDYAFLPMNLPYTMTPEMVADAAKTFKPEVLYPYHYGETDTSKIVELLRNCSEIEVRIRDMK